ncbi:MAG TPA: tetraacyldisaccharide 4'-kinase [Gemmatimonadales bacterium]|nr:tetraacyldisaccharide 4'-kinase [Gemmatimonadales bacterium]
MTAWLWGSRAPLARGVRAALLPFAVVYDGAMRLRARAYATRVRRTERLPLPAIAVGNLSVGGTGKTPLAAWIAAYALRHGARPAILLRGYGGDETLVHERLTPGVIVVADPDRRAGAARALAAGATVLVLDDAFQRLDVARDVNIAVLSAEGEQAARWPLPAGPWREGWWALIRADLIVVTRKRASAGAAQDLAARLAVACPGTPVAVAHLALGRLTTLRSGRLVASEALVGKRVVAAAGVGDPASFAAQIGALGATVRLEAFPDHHAYGAADVARLVRAAAAADYLMVTEKDAVKLHARWPADAGEPLVGHLEVNWETQGGAVRGALDRVLAGPPPPPPPRTDRP